MRMIKAMKMEGFAQKALAPKKMAPLFKREAIGGLGFKVLIKAGSP